MNPSSLAFAAVLIITSTTILRKSRAGESFRVMEVVIFGFMLLIALLVMAIVLPSIARILAYLGIVGAFVVNGPAVFKLAGDFGRGSGTL